MYRNYVRQLRDLVDNLEFVEPIEAQQYVNQLQTITNSLINVITQQDTEHNLTVKLGQEFQIERDENTSTGYSWDAVVSDGLEIVNDQQFRSVNRPGYGGKRVWTLRATKKGPQIFTAVYKKPWLMQTDEDTVYTVNINVE